MYIAIHTTTNSKRHANKIARLLLEEELCACAQISKIQSLYIWKEKICEHKEFLLQIKSRAEHFKQIARIIKQHHNYQTPQIISLPIDNVESAYEDWLKGALANKIASHTQKKNPKKPNPRSNQAKKPKAQSKLAKKG